MENKLYYKVRQSIMNTSLEAVDKYDNDYDVYKAVKELQFTLKNWKHTKKELKEWFLVIDIYDNKDYKEVHHIARFMTRFYELAKEIKDYDTSKSK